MHRSLPSFPGPWWPTPWPSLDPLCVTHGHYLRDRQVHLLSTLCSRPSKTQLVQKAHTPSSSSTGTWEGMSDTFSSPWHLTRPTVPGHSAASVRMQRDPGLFYDCSSRRRAAQALRSHPGRPKHTTNLHICELDSRRPAQSPALSKRW